LSWPHVTIKRTRRSTFQKPGSFKISPLHIMLINKNHEHTTIKKIDSLKILLYLVLMQFDDFSRKYDCRIVIVLVIIQAIDDSLFSKCRVVVCHGLHGKRTKFSMI